MAVVYRAEQVSLGRQVALKVLSPQLSGDPVFRERFRREGTHAARLDHPNIVPVYDASEVDGVLFIAMRLVEGATLAERMRDGGLSLNETFTILTPIADALDMAHADGLVHRDIKPQNILLAPSGHPYLADFGVAKRSDGHALTATRGFVGTVDYASPEQIRAEPLTPASDIYSLTAVLYQCLTGQVPYPMETDAGVMQAHLDKPPPKVGGTLPALDAVIARGMAKEAGDRYDSASALITAARRAVRDVDSTRRESLPAFPIDELQAARPAPEPAPARSPAPEERVIAPISATVADSRREAPPPAPVVKERKKRPWPLYGAIAAAILAPVLAFILAPRSHNPKQQTASAGPVEVRFQSPWHRTADKVDIGAFTLQPGTVLSDGRARLTFGTVARPAPLAGALPPSLAAALAAHPATATQRLGPLTVVRYTSKVAKTKQPVVVLIVPSTQGDLALLCEAPDATGLNACEGVAATAALHGAAPLQPGPDLALATGLAKAMATLTAGRAGAVASLSSRVVAKRASAAARLASADAAALKVLGSLKPRPADKPALASLDAAIKAEQAALGQVAGAARRKDRAGFDRGRARLRAADAKIQAALKAFAQRGYALKKG